MVYSIARSFVVRIEKEIIIRLTLRNVVFVASANAIEVGVLSLSTEENVWYQWNLDESARVILPMNKTEETFPVGVAVDYSSQIQTPIGINFVEIIVQFSQLSCNCFSVQIGEKGMLNEKF